MAIHEDPESGEVHPLPLTLHQVRWRRGLFDWTDGPANASLRFEPICLEVGLVHKFDFTARSAELDSLWVQFGTYCRRNEGILVATLVQGDGAILCRCESALAQLPDNRLHRVLDLASVRLSPGTPYRVMLTLLAEAGNEIAVYATQGAPRSDKDMRFTPWRRSRRDVVDGENAALRLLREHDKHHRAACLQPGDRIAVCTHALPAGGAERQWIYLATGLRQAGYDVRFVLYREPKDDDAHYLRLLEQAAIPTVHLDALPGTRLAAMLAETGKLTRALCGGLVEDPDRLARLMLALRDISPRAVYAQLDDPNIYVGLAALLTGVPRVAISFRNYNPTNFPFIHNDSYGRTYRLLCRSSRTVVTGNSDAANRDYEAWIGLTPGRAACVPNAVSARDFQPPSAEDLERCRAEFGLAPGQPVILGVMRLSPEKNPSAFLEVCSRLAQHRPALRVIVAGVGPSAASLETLAGQLGLDGIVRFVGRRTDINVLMAISTLLLLASDREGMPNVLLEAQLMGLPVVATDTGASRMAVADGVSGRICPVGDIASLAAACSDILDDPVAAFQMGQAGICRTKADFSIASMATRYVELANAPSARSHIYVDPADPDAMGVPCARAVLGSPRKVGVAAECRFFSSLTSAEGVFKTTAPRRMDDINEAFASVWRGSRSPNIADVGASSGLTTAEWQADLEARGLAPTIVATDNMLDAVISKVGHGHYVLAEPSGRILQHEVDGHAVRPQDYTPLPARSRPTLGLLAGRWGAWRRATANWRTNVRLVSSRALGIEFVFDDVLMSNPASFRGAYDVVRAANLLNHCYFTPEHLRLAVMTLKERLRGPGAMLILNRTAPDHTNHASFLALADGGHMELVGRVGNGSEIESLALTI